MLNVCIGGGRALSEGAQNGVRCFSSGGSTAPTSPVSQLTALLQVAVRKPKEEQGGDPIKDELSGYEQSVMQLQQQPFCDTDVAESNDLGKDRAIIFDQVESSDSCDHHESSEGKDIVDSLERSQDLRQMTTESDSTQQVSNVANTFSYNYAVQESQQYLFHMGAQYFGSGSDDSALVSAMLASSWYDQSTNANHANVPPSQVEPPTQHHTETCSDPDTENQRGHGNLEDLLLAQGLINNTSSLVHNFFRQPMAYSPDVSPPVNSQQHKAVAFLAGPRERIHVMGSPVEFCPRCKNGGITNATWRPHRHIGELKIRYICERHFDDLESPHHFDIPLCPVCNQVLYIYEFNSMLGVSNARRLHKYVLKCCNRHVLPLLDLLCQTKKGGERCNANFKLQWCYGTMVKRCEAQKNRDHDLWWVRYKNEWKQRRTIIRYKKDFLSHLSESQRGLLLGLGLEGEPPPDPEASLGPTFDILLNTSSSMPQGLKLRKRPADRLSLSVYDSSTASDRLSDLEHQVKRRQRLSEGSFGVSGYSGLGPQHAMYFMQQQDFVGDHANSNISSWGGSDMTIVTGTPTTAWRPGALQQPPVAASVIGITLTSGPLTTSSLEEFSEVQPGKGENGDDSTVDSIGERCNAGDISIQLPPECNFPATANQGGEIGPDNLEVPGIHL